MTTVIIYYISRRLKDHQQSEPLI